MQVLLEVVGRVRSEWIDTEAGLIGTKLVDNWKL